MAETSKGAAIGSIDIILKARQDQLKKDIADAKKTVSEFSKSIKSLDFEKAIDIGKGLAASKAGMASLAATGFYKFSRVVGEQIDQTVKFNREQRDLGATIGLAGSQVARYDGAFSRLGSSVDVGRSGLKSYTDLIADLNTGSEDATLTLRGLGLSVDAIRKAGGGGFKETLIQISRLNTAAEQQAALQRLFPAQAEQLFKVTRLGAKAIEGSYDAVTTMGEASTQQLSVAEERWRLIGGYVRGFFSSIGEGISSTVGAANAWLADVASRGDSAALGLFGVDIEGQVKHLREGQKSVAEIAKTQAANLAVDKQLADGERKMNAFRNDRLKIEQEINKEFHAADAAKRQELIDQRISSARQDIGGLIDDSKQAAAEILNPRAGLRRRIARDFKLATPKQQEDLFNAKAEEAQAGYAKAQARAQAEIVDLLDHEAGLRAKIAADMPFATEEQIAKAKSLDADRITAQLDLNRKRTQADILSLVDKEAGLRAKIAVDLHAATKEQRDQVFELERAKDAALFAANFRGGLPGYADKLAKQELDNSFRRGGLTEAEYGAARLGQQYRKREGLGDSITPEERRALRDLSIRADTSLSPEDQSRALANSQIKLQKEQMDFLQSFGRITSPGEEFRQAASEISEAIKQGKLTRTDGARALSDSYAKLDTGPRMAQSLDFGSDAYYRRIASRAGGYDRKDPNTRVAEYAGKSVSILERIDKNLAKTLKDQLVSIK